VAALLGRDAVFVLQRALLSVSAMLIREMSLRSRTPIARRCAFVNALDFSPIAEGIRYVRKDRR